MQLYRLYPFLCRAIRELVIERSEAAKNETKLSRLQRTEFYLGIIDVKIKHQLRHLTSDKVGKLIRISGQVVRTHQVHPELCFGTFVCDDCGVATKHVAQQFKYTQVRKLLKCIFLLFDILKPIKCENQQCQNRTRFMLNVYDSQFVDFQRLRIQENQDELPLGSVPRNVDVIVRGESVEAAQPGDHCDFIGTLIVIPDVSMLATPGFFCLNFENLIMLLRCSCTNQSTHSHSRCRPSWIASWTQISGSARSNLQNRLSGMQHSAFKSNG